MLLRITSRPKKKTSATLYFHCRNLCTCPAEFSVFILPFIVYLSCRFFCTLRCRYQKYVGEGFDAPRLNTLELVQTGEIGQILTFKTCFGHAGPESWSIDKSASTWFFDKNMTTIGSLGDLGVHKIDLMRWLLQDEFDEVSAFTATLDKRNSAGELIGIDDNVVCILKTQKGLMGTLSNSWTYYGEEDNSTILYGTKGILKIYAHPDFPLELIRRDGSFTHYKVGKIATNIEQVKSGIIDLFVESLIRNEQPPITGVDGLRSIQVVNAILESAETKKTVTVS